MTNLSERIGQTYDELPYTSNAFRQSAPEHLASVAHLFGLDAPAIDGARVLEIGCAAGGNLLPFAARHPKAQVVGIDLSATQIESGRRAVEATGLANVQLLQGSIADLDPALGPFDYVLCHGVYSWVPGHVREAILRVCGTMLSPQGVAYISYNAYPGWKAKEIVRDAMMLRGGDRATQQERLAYARGMVEFLHEMAPADSLLAKVIGQDIDLVRNGRDYYLAHEYLELCNAPCYFLDFVGAARAHGLDYLGDATVASMFASNYGAAAQPLLNECGGDQVRLEQLMDFLRNRTFRQTLLVHAEQSERIRYQLDRARVSQLHLAGQYVPVQGEADRWAHANGEAHLTAATPPLRAVLDALNAAWPATVPVQTLLDAAPAEDAERVVAFVNAMIIGNAVSFRRDSQAASNSLYVRPEVRALAALAESPLPLFNEWHESIRLQPLEHFLVARMDGQRDEAQLADMVAQAIGEGALSLVRDGAPVQDADDIATSARTLTRDALVRIKNHALLAPFAAPKQAAQAAAAPAKPQAKPSAAKPKAAAKPVEGKARTAEKPKPTGRKK